jgi:hypothetical protein
MATNNFLEFDTEKLNMQTDEEYVEETQRVSGVAGIAKSKVHNKLFRQVSVMVAALGEFIKNAEQTASDADKDTLVSAISNAFASKPALDEVSSQLAATAKAEKAGGTATTITLSSISLTDGSIKTFIVTANNNAAATTINSKPLYKPGTTAAPKLVSGKAVTVWFDATGNCFFIKASAEGDVVVDNVLAGKTFSNDDDTGLTGTMVDRSGTGYVTPTAITSTSGQVIADILSGAYLVNTAAGAVQVVLDDPDFVASNFLATKVVFGLQGSIPVIGGTSVAGTLVASTPGDGTIRVRPPTGYYDGANGVTYISDPDFISANILATKNIFGLQGGIPDRSPGHTQAQSVTSGNGIVYLGPPPGYYNGDNANNNAWVYAAHSDFTPANILAGKSPFGLAGALVPGKKVVSGTASINGAEFFKYADGSITSSLYSITVSGLTFTPSMIIIYRNDVGDGYEYNTVYRATGRSYAKIAMLSINSPSVSTLNAYNVRADVTPAYINSTGFKLPVPTNGTFNWTAIE